MHAVQCWLFVRRCRMAEVVSIENLLSSLYDVDVSLLLSHDSTSHISLMSREWEIVRYYFVVWSCHFVHSQNTSHTSKWMRCKVSCHTLKLAGLNNCNRHDDDSSAIRSIEVNWIQFNLKYYFEGGKLAAVFCVELLSSHIQSWAEREGEVLKNYITRTRVTAKLIETNRF